MQEPSVLDFIKSRTHYWWNKLFHPSDEVEVVRTDSEFWREETVAPALAPVEPVPVQTVGTAVLRFPWPVFLVLGFGLWAQLSLEPQQGAARTWQLGLIFYVLAALALVLTRSRHTWQLQAWEESVPATSQERTFLRSAVAFIVALVFALIAFIAFKPGLFNTFNVFAWVVATLSMVIAFLYTGVPNLSWISRLRNFLVHPKLNLSFSRSTLLFLIVFAFILFFRFYKILDVPSQMISDHAEKLLDVGDVLNGKTSTFFPRNTGREFVQFYLTAGIALLFKTGLSYLSLKIGTISAGVITVVYMYLLGKEMGNQRVGLLTLLFAGIAYWPNIISRFGLRFPFYPAFYAPALYYLVWGLRTRNRLGFVLSGLFIGFGLNGYSPYRIVPFVVVVAIALYLIHKQSEGYRTQAVWGLVIVGIMAFLIFIPLLRYMIENPGIVFYRALTRLGDLERPLPGSPLQIFLSNFRNSMTMFAWDNGEIWPISVPHRPAFDVVTAVFFHLGVVLLFIRYLRQRHWLDIFTLVSIPLLMMPSILSLTFPGENPSFNRSAGAIIPVFLIVALAFDAFLKALETTWSRRLTWVLGFFLIAWASLQNYDLVFNQYRKQYDLSAWNTTEMGAVVRSFAELNGSPDTAWLVGYPYWADSRLVMINAGYPFMDNAIWPQNFQDTVNDPRAKLFLINVNDVDDKNALQALYPNGWLTEFQSKYETKNFLMFFVPAQPTITQ